MIIQVPHTLVLLDQRQNTKGTRCDLLNFLLFSTKKKSIFSMEGGTVNLERGSVCYKDQDCSYEYCIENIEQCRIHILGVIK